MTGCQVTCNVAGSDDSRLAVAHIVACVQGSTGASLQNTSAWTMRMINSRTLRLQKLSMWAGCSSLGAAYSGGSTQRRQGLQSRPLVLSPLTAMAEHQVRLHACHHHLLALLLYVRLSMSCHTQSSILLRTQCGCCTQFIPCKLSLGSHIGASCKHLTVSSVSL